MDEFQKNLKSLLKIFSKTNLKRNLMNNNYQMMKNLKLISPLQLKKLTLNSRKLQKVQNFKRENMKMTQHQLV